MSVELAEAIENLNIGADAVALVEVLRLRDRLDARIIEALGEFDRAGLWDLDGATSLTAWLRSSAGMTTRAAGRMSLLARRLRLLPVARAAMRDGSLSGGQVEAIVAQLDEKSVELFAD